MNPVVNYGQSNFVDAFFLVGAQLTPYRKLRQIELEIMQIEDSLKELEFKERRNILLLADLSDEIPLQKLEKDEINYRSSRNQALKRDAEVRLEQFRLMREQTLERAPEGYWNQSYEEAEPQHWVLHYGKQAAAEIALQGQVSFETAAKIKLLPATLRQNVLEAMNNELSEVQLLTQA